MSFFKNLCCLLLVSYILFAHRKLSAQLTTIHIGIAITNQDIKNQLRALQTEIESAAGAHSYLFDAQLKHDFHITLVTINTNKYEDIITCEKCLSKVVKSMEQFDLAQELQKGNFEIFPQNTQSKGVWLLAVEPNGQLNRLRNAILHCLAQAGLRVGTLFTPHITLGIFTPKHAAFKAQPLLMHVPRWMPIVSMRSKVPFMVEKLQFTFTEKGANAQKEIWTRDLTFAKTENSLKKIKAS